MLIKKEQKGKKSGNKIAKTSVQFLRHNSRGERNSTAGRNKTHQGAIFRGHARSK